MDIWVMLGLILAVLGVAISIYYGRKQGQPLSSRRHEIVVRVTNNIPVFDLPDGRQELGDHFVAVEAVNTGERAITITGWGVELPDGRRVFVTRPPNWATRLPHELRPGAAPARLLIAADELRRINRDEKIAFDDMRPYVDLADGTKVYSDRPVPLA